METRKLYYEDAYMTEFDAGVLGCEPGKQEGVWLITLDQTAFYPEGGGQPADKGSLGGVSVTDVHEKGESVVHYCTGPLEPGARVHGCIDWERRFDHMQQHSGEHVVSGMICFGLHCDNIGFHLGEKTVTIDFNTQMSMEDALAIEEKANRYIWENHGVEILWPTAEELEQLYYRSKKELSGKVRIVNFPGADICACCGTHVNFTGEVGLVKILSCGRIKDGTGSRLELVCGQRALDYLNENWRQNQLIGRELCGKFDDTARLVTHAKEELIEAKMKISAMEEKLFGYMAGEYAGKGDVLLIEEEMSPDSVRKLCVMIGSVCGGRAAVFAGKDGSYKYAVCHQDHEIRDFVKEMNTALNGRGGGKGGFAQGSAAADKNTIESFFKTA